MKEIILFPPATISKAALEEVIHCNEITLRYGLELSCEEALDLIETRSRSLLSYGRIEFAGGVINKIILAFCNSPYLSHHNYAETLNDLLETFYYYKNETLDEISDDELITLMKDYFDHQCQGSIALLQNRELELLARNVRYGVADYTKVTDGSKNDWMSYYFDEYYQEDKND
ncbi:DUF6323 family protein [Dehalobacter sp. DCM]|uniref:DUF6323 family protein n=1 Tax=Dehalobacter sp. DCM TaxID=2907827 RepID=UPI0030819E2C|nr:DUF6323 family protein [Dehalobacter sp. DCM]